MEKKCGQKNAAKNQYIGLMLRKTLGGVCFFTTLGYWWGEASISTFRPYTVSFSVSDFHLNDHAIMKRKRLLMVLNERVISTYLLDYEISSTGWHAVSHDKLIDCIFPEALLVWYDWWILTRIAIAVSLSLRIQKVMQLVNWRVSIKQKHAIQTQLSSYSFLLW